MASRSRVNRQVLVGGLISGLVVFAVVHAWLCWALSVILRDRFLSLFVGFFPLLASAVFTVVLIVTFFFSLLKQAAELSVVGADIFDKFMGWTLQGAAIVAGRQVELAPLLKGIDISLFRGWGAYWSGIAKVISGGWLALASLALLRYQSGQYNPLVIVLLAGVFASLLFRKWGVAVAFCVLLAAYLLLLDNALARVEVPEVDVNLPKISAPMTSVPPREIAIVGGSTNWVTVYQDLPFANRFDVEYVSGNVRIATQTGDIVDHRGLLQQNGVPFDIRTAKHLLDAGVAPADWLVSDEGATPFSLVACISDGPEAPRAEDAFTVRREIVVHKGHTLHLWYNHLVRGPFAENYKNDRGQYVILLKPIETDIPE